MAFKPGQSGNPGGKRPGTKNKKLELFRSDDEKLQRKVLSMALGGDIAAMKIIADRLWPRLRAQAPPISIDAASHNISEQGKKIIDAALSGEITTDVLRDLLTALYAQGKLIELSEFEERLKALEEHREPPPWESQRNDSELASNEKLLPIRGKRRRLKNESKR